jgi:hypothetical protein
MSTTITRRELDGVSRRITACRQAEKVARDQHAAARAAWERAGEPGEGSPEYLRWERGKEAVDQATHDLARAEGEQRGVLGRYAKGNGDGPRTGDGPLTNGWERLATELRSTPQGIEASVPLDSLLKPPAYGAIGVTPAAGWTAPSYEVEGVVPIARDVRFLYPLLPSQQVEPGDLGVQELKQTGKREATGAVERDPMATTAKAAYASGITLVQEPLKQLAIYADSVPSKLFDAAQGLGDGPGMAAPALGPGSLLLAWLTTDLGYMLERAYDAHDLAQIVAAKPAFGLTGTGLITQIRNAVSAHRALGANPSILAVPPKTAIELDSLEDAQKRPIFPTGVVGGASPLFSLNVVELQSEEHAPILIDPTILGVNYYSLGTLLVDPFSKAQTNQVNVRLEFDVLFHVRDVSGAYALSATALK